jgi:hypothetical protein
VCKGIAYFYLEQIKIKFLRQRLFGFREGGILRENYELRITNYDELDGIGWIQGGQDWRLASNAARAGASAGRYWTLLDYDS